MLYKIFLFLFKNIARPKNNRDTIIIEDSTERALFLSKKVNKIVNTTNAPSPIGPYNQAIIAGNIMFISGTIAMDLNSKQLIKTTIKEETKIVMDYIGEILKAGGCSYENVAKSTIFLADLLNTRLLRSLKLL